MVLNMADLVRACRRPRSRPHCAVACGDRRVDLRASWRQRANRLAHHLARSGRRPRRPRRRLRAQLDRDGRGAASRCTSCARSPINVNYRYVENELRYCSRQRGRRRRSCTSAACPAGWPPCCPTCRSSGTSSSSRTAPRTTASPTATARSSTRTRWPRASPERDFGPRDPGDLYMLYTGGTTGRPEGRDVAARGRVARARRRHRLHHRRAAGRRVGAVAGAATRLRAWSGSCVAPLIHGNAQWATLGAAVRRRHRRPDAAVRPARDLAGRSSAEKVNVMAIVGDAMARPLIEAYHEGGYDALVAVRHLQHRGAVLAVGQGSSTWRRSRTSCSPTRSARRRPGFTGIGSSTKRRA